MAQVNATLIVYVIGGHVLEANLIVDAVSRSAYRCHNIGSRRDRIRYVRTHLRHLPEVFVTGDEELLSLSPVAVFRSIDSLLCAITTHAHHLHHYPYPISTFRTFSSP